MATATRTEAREVTENHTADSLEYLKPGDRVLEAGVFQVQVGRTETVPGKVTLELTEEESQFLADIMARISGDMTKSRRRFQTEISDALQGVGIPFRQDIDLRGGITALGGDFHPLPG